MRARPGPPAHPTPSVASSLETLQMPRVTRGAVAAMAVRGKSGGAVGAAVEGAAVGAAAGEDATVGATAMPAAPAKPRAARVYFLGQKFAVHHDDVRVQAFGALTAARAEQTEWDPDAWRARASCVLEPFRIGIKRGGARVATAAVGANEPEAPVAEPTATRPSEPSSKRPRVAKAATVPSDGWRDKLRLLPPFELVGSGAFGKVYGCHARPTSAVGDSGETHVAVKVINKFEDVKDEKQGADLLPEIRRELDHLKECVGASKGLVDLLSWTETTFDVQLVFPFFKEDVFTALRRGAFKAAPTKNDEDCLPGICKQLLEGLCVLHAHRIVHRDLKPGNILLETAAVGATQTAAVGAKIADFGSSIKCDMDPGKTGCKLVGSLWPEVGTYQYRAPELFAKGADCTYAADVWALGTTFVHMETARVPFGRERLQRSQIGEVFSDAVKAVSTWRRPADYDFPSIRKKPVEFLARLRKMQPRPARELPWGKERGLAFKEFTRGFFALDPDSRPLARKLAAHAWLS